MRKAHNEKPWVRERMRQENRSSPQCQALSPQVAAMLFQKKSENTKIWNHEQLVAKIRKDAKSNQGKVKLLS